MCKVLLIAGIKPDKVKKVWEFAQTISKPMSRSNKDGLGYAAITAEGKIFGERWLDNDHAFQTEDPNCPVVEVFGNAVEKKGSIGEYNSFGELQRDNMVALTLHTRYATTPKGMMNTHPFIDEGISLIHNGIIRNHNEYKLNSTCDSEAILRAYQINGVAADPSKVDDMAHALKGYYACGVLTNTDIGPTLDIFKSNASLHVAFVKQLDTFVVSTDDDDIKDTCRILGYDMGVVFKIFDGKFIRVNAITGKESQVLTFKESVQWEYSGGHNGYSHNNHTTVTQTIEPKYNNVVVYDKGKRKENTTISQEMMDYFMGTVGIQELSEREVQESIMHYERMTANGKH